MVDSLDPSPPPAGRTDKEVAVHDDTLIGILDRALQAQNNTNKDGFNRLEAVGREQQRDLRIIALALLGALLVSTGATILIRLADTELNFTPAAVAPITAAVETP